MDRSTATSGRGTPEMERLAREGRLVLHQGRFVLADRPFEFRREAQARPSPIASPASVALVGFLERILACLGSQKTKSLDATGRWRDDLKRIAASEGLLERLCKGDAGLVRLAKAKLAGEPLLFVEGARHSASDGTARR